MSEVKRYEWTRNGMRVYAPPMGRYVQSTDFDAAQVELAALREELVLAKDTAASWKYSADGLAEEAHEIDKRLTAAEQRNAELAELLSEVIPYESYLGSKLFKRISAAITPTDPVQAVCTSCDGSGEYSDAIGDWRGYCSCAAGVELKNSSPQAEGIEQLWSPNPTDAHLASLLIVLGQAGIKVSGGTHGDPWTVSSPPAPVAVVHTMKSVMSAVCAAHNFPMLTSNQCQSLADALNAFLDKVKEMNR